MLLQLVSQLRGGCGRCGPRCSEGQTLIAAEAGTENTGGAVLDVLDNVFVRETPFSLENVFQGVAGALVAVNGNGVV